MPGKPRPGSGRSNYRNIYRDEFLCYSDRNCDRPKHMRYYSLTEPYYIRGHIVDSTNDGVCLDMEYEQFPWQGVCAYLEIHNPGLYTFGTPCDCGEDGLGSIRHEDADLNERVCIWQGARCGGTIVRTASPPRPALPPYPPGAAPPPPPSPPVGPPSPAVPAMGMLAGCAALAATMRSCTAAATGVRAIPV